MGIFCHANTVDLKPTKLLEAYQIPLYAFEKRMMHNIHKSRFRMTTQPICRILVEEAFQDRSCLYRQWSGYSDCFLKNHCKKQLTIKPSNVLRKHGLQKISFKNFCLFYLGRGNLQSSNLDFPKFQKYRKDSVQLTFHTAAHLTPTSPPKTSTPLRVVFLK